MQQDQLLLSKIMRNFIYIILAAALLATSCEKEPLASYPDGSLPIHHGYMKFSTGVSTRAQLVTDMKEKKFGVLGYKYSSTTNWATAKAIAIPNTFYNLEVSCAENGTCTYDAYPSDNDKNYKEWEEGNYSFFAYYPYTDKNNGIGISLSAENATNTPMLNYTYPWLDPKDEDNWYVKGFTSMDNKGKVQNFDLVNLCDASAPVYDLMTAEAIDVNGTGAGTVGLDFKHRMFALEVLANNYNENSEGTFDARQSITGLVLTLEGLKHSSMSIPLSTQSDEIDPTYGGTMPDKYSFLISDPMNTVVIPAFNETMDGRGEGVATSISKLGGRNGNAGYLMLIPQTTGLVGQLNWTQLANFPGTISTSFTSNIEFKPGKLYQLYINYVGSGITIALIEAGAWDVHDVEHKFE